MNSVADYEELVIMNEFMKEQTKAEVKLQGVETTERCRNYRESCS